MGTSWLRVEAKRLKALPPVDISLDFDIYLAVYKELIIRVKNNVEIFIIKRFELRYKKRDSLKKNTRDKEVFIDVTLI